jgi:hypothetical protein
VIIIVEKAAACFKKAYQACNAPAFAAARKKPLSFKSGFAGIASKIRNFP